MYLEKIMEKQNKVLTAMALKQIDLFILQAKGFNLLYKS